MSTFGDALSDSPRRRARAFRRLQFVVLSLVIAYFFLPYSVRAWIPVWLPFLAALGLELNFFLGGYLQGRRGMPEAKPDRAPQARDLVELGGAPEWLDEEELADLPVAPDPDELAVGPSYWRYALEAGAVIAVAAGLLYFASRPQGWDAVPTADQARAEAAFSREASLVAGHPARVTCDTSGRHVGFVQDADGSATIGGSQAYVTPSICNTLYGVAFEDRVESSPRAGRAIAVLAHEAWHLRGVRDEGLANCFGFQSGVQIGINLGLGESNARALMREQLATNASDARGNPAYLVPPGCHDGGEYDLNPTKSGFP